VIVVAVSRRSEDATQNTLCRGGKMGGPKRLLPQQSVLDEAQLLAFLDREGIKHVHAKTIWRHVLKTGGVGGIADVAGTLRLAGCDGCETEGESSAASPNPKPWCRLARSAV
jgi:hypothetical protein